MSLSSLLLAAGPKKIDSELDALFKSNRKKKKKKQSQPDPSPPKIAKQAAKPKPAKKSKRAEPVVEMDVDSDGSDEDDEDNSDLENAYLGKLRPKTPATAPSPDSEDEDAEDAGDDSASNNSDAEDSDTDAPPPVHESLTKRVRTKPAKKTKIVPENETPVQRDARTLFVGGLPAEVAQKRVLKIESIRFRSVAFRDPTSATAMSSASTPSTSSAAPSTGNPNSIPVPNHSAARASTWRKTGGDEKEKQVAAEAEAEGDAKKAYLTPAQKKKILFIQGAFHPEAKSVTGMQRRRRGEEEGKDDTPYAAAARLARAANASEFMGRVLRVDVCARLPLADAGAGAGAAGAGAGANEDPKLSIFLGNLDFASTESDVREFFEGVVVASERGPAPADDGTGRWVQTVRLIRDRETQLGKGFGYISFVDRECVDEILALGKTDEGKKKLKFAKRTVAGAALSRPKSKSSYTSAPPVRGDPTLGARLAHLDKDARKAAKKADPGARAAAGGEEEGRDADPGRE
ncbi:hypothetical protein B0H14DRAFT_3512868 [Mycena olivaceomarginata]|nr:hypothetical protein B0H14DRAFT_3512868 [Mycena olivaceomarginata]